jgi:uncharacterized tellurite resistance protein B-like protein
VIINGLSLFAGPAHNRIMFESLLRRLSSPAAGQLPDPDARLALAALFVRIAKADGVYAAPEIARIDRLLMRRFGLDPVAAAKLRAAGEALEHEAPDTVRFTRAIKEAVPYEDRLAVVESLWDVSLADGRRDEDEDALLRLVAPMLGVTDQDSALARRRVEARSRTGGPWA